MELMMIFVKLYTVDVSVENCRKLAPLGSKRYRRRLAEQLRNLTSLYGSDNTD